MMNNKFDDKPFNINKDSTLFPYGHFFSKVGGKWKPYLLVVIKMEGSLRFNEISKRWGVSSKVLSQQLSELENDGFIYKVVGNEKMLRTDYYLTQDGEKIMGILKEIYKWGLEDMKKKGLPIDPRSYTYTKSNEDK